MQNSYTSPPEDMDSRETLPPVPVTEMEVNDSNQSWGMLEEKRGRKRTFSGAKKPARVPITEKQLTILKKRAKEVMNRLDEILDLEFVQELGKIHVCNFISARGEFEHFLKNLTPDSNLSVKSLPKWKRQRRAESENLSTNRFGDAVRSRRRGRGRENSMVPSWPRPSLSSLRQNREPFNQPNRRKWEYPKFPSSRVDVGDDRFDLHNDSYQNSVSRGFRSNAPRGRARGFTAQRSNSARPKPTRKSKDLLRTRCELCDVELCGEVSVKQHMAGKRHRAALNAKAQEEEIQDDQEPEPFMHEINIGD